MKLPRRTKNTKPLSIPVPAALSLRELGPDDLEALFSTLKANAEFFKKVEFSGANIQTKQEISELIQKSEKERKEGRSIRFGLFSQNKIIGQVDLHEIQWEHRKAEIGYWLSEEHCGKGSAKQALSTLIKFAFLELKLHRLEATTSVNNKPSIKLLERLGFTREGKLREAFCIRGRYVDDYLYSLLASDTPSLALLKEV